MNWKSWAGFKYDKRWVHREGFTDLMARFWSQTAANTESSMMEKIASCRKEISQWKRRCKPSSAVRIQELQFRIDAATRQIPFNPQLLKDLRKELNHEYYQEEQFWSQKSRVTWFNEGDKNTKFFHATTKNRRAQNRIQKLIDDDGNEWLTDAQLGKVAEAYFRKLFASEDIGYQSIHEAQDLIKQGIRVVIGNGASTNIWKDPWISSKPAKGVLSTRMLPQGLHHSALNLSFVKDLIVDQGREWNLELLRSLFPEEVVSSISQIRLGACNTKDCFAWDYSLDGQYSVKSGYWVQMQVIRQERGIREVLQPSLSPIYHQIWSSDNPPKIQHFLWRCVSNCLSVAGNLYHRHLARDGACARCPNHVESVNHLLFTCSFARLVWAISPIPAPPGGEWTNFIYQNMYSLLISNQLYPYLGGISKVAPWLLWRLWKSRNDLIFKGKEVHAQEVVKRAIEDMEEWSMRQEKLSKPPPAPISGNRRAKWSPPHSSWVKCNVDGAWSKESLRCGIGWILRDHENQVLWLGARTLPMTSKALEVEIEGFRWAVLSLIRLNYRRIIFESDSQQTLNLIRGDMVNSHFSPIIQDIQQLLQRFEEVKLSFTFREGNGVTDRIAKESLSFQNYDPKLYSVLPDWVKSYVEAENCI
ncbi:unnamed protein product [Arabidopsis thaliana]|nr:unnamed protein product [Arabidopsis thaliana]